MPSENVSTPTFQCRPDANLLARFLGREQYCEGKVCDVSRTGMRVMMPYALPPRTQVLVRHKRLRLTADAVVRHISINATGYKTGLEFVGGFTLRQEKLSLLITEIQPVPVSAPAEVPVAEVSSVPSGSVASGAEVSLSDLAACEATISGSSELIHTDLGALGLAASGDSHSVDSPIREIDVDSAALASDAELAHGPVLEQAVVSNGGGSRTSLLAAGSAIANMPMDEASLAQISQSIAG